MKEIGFLTFLDIPKKCDLLTLSKFTKIALFKYV